MKRDALNNLLLQNLKEEICFKFNFDFNYFQFSDFVSRKFNEILKAAKIKAKYTLNVYIYNTQNLCVYV